MRHPESKHVRPQGINVLLQFLFRNPLRYYTLNVESIQLAFYPCLFGIRLYMSFTSYLYS